MAAVHQAPQEIQEFLAWQQDLESDSKSPTTQARPTVFRWSGSGKEVFVSGSFNNWATKIPLNRRYGRATRVAPGRQGVCSCCCCNSPSCVRTQPEQLCGHRGPAGGRAPVQVLRGRPVDARSHRGQWTHHSQFSPTSQVGIFLTSIALTLDVSSRPWRRPRPEWSTTWSRWTGQTSRCLMPWGSTRRILQISQVLLPVSMHCCCYSDCYQQNISSSSWKHHQSED